MTRAVQSLTIVESDTGHPLISLLGLRLGEGRVTPAQTSGKEEWAQEAGAEAAAPQGGEVWW